MSLKYPPFKPVNRPNDLIEDQISGKIYLPHIPHLNSRALGCMSQFGFLQRNLNKPSSNARRAHNYDFWQQQKQHQKKDAECQRRIANSAALVSFDVFVRDFLAILDGHRVDLERRPKVWGKATSWGGR